LPDAIHQPTAYGQAHGDSGRGAPGGSGREASGGYGAVLPYRSQPGYGEGYPGQPGTELVPVAAGNEDADQPEGRRSPVFAVLLIVLIALIGGAVAAVVAFMVAKP
jgi:hypothetical protein